MINQRLVLLAFVLGSLISAAVLQSASVSLFQFFDVQDTRVGGLFNSSDILALVGGALTFIILIRNVAAVRFTDEVVGELRKVTWPSRDEALNASTTVIFTALFVAFVISIYDLVWKQVADFFLYNG
jgi:preprotein translocase SecE subunit